MLITENQLLEIAVTPDKEKLTPIRAGVMTDIINRICPKYGIVNDNILEEFLAQVCHESECFRIKLENMNYTTIKVLMDTWPSRFKTTASAAPFIKNPQGLANYVYNNRMGNKPESNDGYFFRGRGYMQLTGRDTATLYFNYVKDRDKENAPKTVEALMELLSSSDEWAMDAACWEFAVNKRLISLALADDFKMITYKINGGYIGMPKREYYYERCKRVLRAA